MLRRRFDLPHWQGVASMTVYTFPVQGLRPVMAVVAAHGATDLNTFECIPAYAMWMLLPLPGAFITTAFLLLSLMHFSQDLGQSWSAALHVAVGLMHVRGNTAGAFRLMLAYLMVVHTPMHYQRCVQRRQWRGIAVALSTTALMLLWPNRLIGKATFVMNHWIQRIVLAHVSHEMALASGF